MTDSPPSISLSIPTSPALAEASPDSLQTLFSRDPEGFQQQDIDRVIAEMRALRARLAEAEAQGKRAPRSPKISLPSLPIAGNPTDLGI